MNCSTPYTARGIVIEPYNDTTEGAVIHFHCNDDFANPSNYERRVAAATCGNDGMWSPQLPGETLAHDVTNLITNA